MGQDTDPDPPGNDCLCCWPAGQTPSEVYISFVAIAPCDKPFDGIPYPFNGLVPVPQDPEDNCIFTFYPDPWQFVYVACSEAGTACSQAWVPEVFFLSHWVENCRVFLMNQLDCAGPHIYGHEGFAAVMWNLSSSDHSIGSLLNSINMEPHAETKFEFWPASEERICVRFARKKDATNILILVEPTEL